MFENLLPEAAPKETFGSCELSLYAADNSKIYENHIVPVIEILAKRIAVGVYTPENAVSAFMPVVNLAALKYEFEFGDREAAKAKTITCFDYEDRKDAALLLLYAHLDLIKDEVRALDL